MYICLSICMWVEVLVEFRRGYWIPGNCRYRRSWVIRCRGWELNFKEQNLPFTTKPSLLTQKDFFKVSLFCEDSVSGSADWPPTHSDLEILILLPPVLECWNQDAITSECGDKLQFFFCHVRCWLAPKNSLFFYSHRFDFKSHTMHTLYCTWFGFELHWDPRVVPLRTGWLQRPLGVMTLFLFLANDVAWWKEQGVSTQLVHTSHASNRPQQQQPPRWYWPWTASIQHS